MKSATVTRLPGSRRPAKARLPPVLEVSASAVDASRRGAPRRANPFVAPLHPPGVAPNGQPIALDSAITDSWSWSEVGWAQTAMSSSFAEGTTFLGYAALSILAQRAEYRVISETIASEMTREWIELKSVGDEDKSEKIAQLDAEMKRLGVQEAFRRGGAVYDGLFGRGHIYVDTGDSDDRDNLKTPIGDGWNLMSRSKIGPKGHNGRTEDRKIVALRPVEPVWCSPTQYDSNDPLKADWYRPTSWHVMGKEVHVTRLLTFVGREVPDLLKPAYSFGGLSMSQMAKPYIDNWLRTRQSVSDLVANFSVRGLKTPGVAASLQAGGDQIFRRADVFNNMSTNSGLMLLDMNEEYFNITTPLSTLEQLQAQSQEHMACLPGDTLVETDRGLVPIHDVTILDKVMTRQGFAPLAWAGRTGYTTELVEIKTSSTILRVTSWHPIFLPETNEFVDAGSVVGGDHLLEVQTSTTSTASQSYGAATGGRVSDLATTAILELVDSCIARSGWFTRVRSLMGSMSIMSTKIRATTNYRTSSSRRDPSITSTICARDVWDLINSTLFGIRRALFAGTSSTPLGTRLCSTVAGDVRQNFTLAAEVYQNERTAILRRASSAVKQLKSMWSQNVDSIAVRRAVDGSLTDVKEITSTEIVTIRRAQSATLSSRLSAGQSRQNDSTAVQYARVRSTVVESTRRIKTSEPVYNLEVAEGFLPEFYANGILVHNSVSRIPLVKLLGIQPAGLNASSEGEIRAFYDWIASFQELLFRPNLHALIGLIMLSLWGETDKDITFEFKDLWQLDAAAKMSVEKVKTDIDDANVAMGSVSPEEVRRRIAKDPDSPYAGLDLDPEALPEPPEPDPSEMLGHNGGPDMDDDQDAAAASHLPGMKPRDPRDPSEGITARAGNLASPTGGFGGAGDLALDADWDENDHSRDDSGRFKNSGEKITFQKSAVRGMWQAVVNGKPQGKWYKDKTALAKNVTKKFPNAEIESFEKSKII